MEYSFTDRLGRLLVVVMMLIGLLLLLAPILTTVILSFSASFTLPPTGLTLRWYENVLSRPEFQSGLKVSLILGAAVVVASTTLGTGIAVALTRRAFRGRAIANFLFLSPIALPAVAIGIAIFVFFVKLNLFGAPVQLFIVHVVVTCPFVIVVMTASLQGIDPSLEEAAMNLGASRWQTFQRITVPLVRPGLLAAAVFAFVISFGEVTASIFVSDSQTMTFPVALFNYLSHGTSDPTVAAASSLMLLVVVLLVGFVARYIGLSRVLGASGPK
jgi:putative spermidine/putrescine transport system permease protein